MNFLDISISRSDRSWHFDASRTVTTQIKGYIKGIRSKITNEFKRVGIKHFFKYI